MVWLFSVKSSSVSGYFRYNDRTFKHYVSDVVRVEGSGGAYRVGILLPGSPGVAHHPPVPKRHPSHPILMGRRGSAQVSVGLRCHLCPSLPVDQNLENKRKKLVSL
jgi:hypothetical protein